MPSTWRSARGPADRQEFIGDQGRPPDQATVDIVVDLCKANSGMVARYYRVKKEMLGLQELTHVDRYAPLAEAKKEIGYDEAWEIVLESFAGFHSEMASLARQFRDENWVDAEPRQGKTSGAFCSYMTPDTHPVVLMTYLNKMSDVGTLAHELGHILLNHLENVDVWLDENIRRDDPAEKEIEANTFAVELLLEKPDATFGASAHMTADVLVAAARRFGTAQGLDPQSVVLNVFHYDPDRRGRNMNAAKALEPTPVALDRIDAKAKDSLNMQELSDEDVEYLSHLAGWESSES